MRSMILWISKVLSAEIGFPHRSCDLCPDLIYDFVCSHQPLSWGQERNTENVIMIFLLLLETKTDVVVDDYEWEAPLWPLNYDQSIIILWRPINQVYVWLMHKANVTFMLYAKIFTLG